MSSKRKCVGCGAKILKTEKACPVCGATFCCKKCGKELEDGTQKYCPVCQMERSEKKKTIVGGTAALGCLLVGVFLHNTNKKKD